MPRIALTTALMAIGLIGFALTAPCAVGGVEAAAAMSSDDITRLIAEETAKNGRVPLAIALAVAKVESNFQEDAESNAGARGVMQIMPATAMGEFGVPASALRNPRLNIKLGVAYLERLYNRYGENWELALSHYNGGSLPVADGRYVAHPYTRQYVADVMKWARVYTADAKLVAGDGPAAAAGPQLASATTDVPAAASDAAVEPAAKAADSAPAAETPAPAALVPAPPAPEQIASAAQAAETPAAAPAPEATAPVTADAKPPAPVATMAREPVAEVPPSPPAQQAPSSRELRERFRARLAQIDQAQGRGAAPAAAEAVTSRAPAPPARAGRFTYAPYGS